MQVFAERRARSPEYGPYFFSKAALGSAPQMAISYHDSSQELSLQRNNRSNRWFKYLVDESRSFERRSLEMALDIILRYELMPNPSERASA